jgi:replicative DNA helicase
MKLSAPVYRLKRKARLLARSENIALNEALDRIAQSEGYARWSHLSAQLASNAPSRALLSRLDPGDLLLLAARPGQGKTLLGLQLLLDALREGRRAVFFTLEYTRLETRERILSLDPHAVTLCDRLEIVTSDDIGADIIIRHLAGSERGTVAVIDYLQILDQRRNKPPLSAQLTALREFARSTGVVLGFISQIDRTFDSERRKLPDLRDVRMPNTIDLTLFSKACFLHAGEANLQDVAC